MEEKRERTKVFDFLGKRWKVDKINALDGSNLLRMFTAAGNSNPQEFLSNMPTEQFQIIQKMLLPNVFIIDSSSGTEVSTSLMLPSGTICMEGNDSGMLFMLTVIALMFNMSGFFEGNTLTEFQEVVKQFNV